MNSPQTRTVDARLASLPTPVVDKVEAAKSLLQHRDAASAEKLLREALASAQDQPEILRLLGMALRLQGRNDDALRAMRRAAELLPRDPLIQNGLGTALDACGQREEAIAAFKLACELAPQSLQLWANFGKTLSEDSRFEEALPVLERAIRLGAQDATELRLAYALRVTGRTDEAARRYRDLLKRNPADGHAWLGLSNLKTRPFSADDAASLQHLWRDGNLDIDNRISIGFSLARALDDQERYVDAFDVLRESNALTRSIRPWDAAWFSRHVDALLSAFSEPQHAAPAAQGEGVIFIVSMPRAGSSLTEQILASHPQVDGAGELIDLSTVIDEESQRRNLAFPHWVPTTRPDDWQRMGQSYLHRTERYRKVRTLFTDKLPDNWLHIGAAMAMLPGARVIDCRRDPVETCFSCYRTLFNEGAQGFTYDIDDLAAYYHDYDRTTTRWRALFSRHFRRQSYETLVAEPETQIRQLLDFCGLPYDAACERFHETQRNVRTASSSQVREPLMRDTARVPKYGGLLDPLRDALKSRS